jgi:hypothetical protein
MGASIPEQSVPTERIFMPGEWLVAIASAMPELATAATGRQKRVELAVSLGTDLTDDPPELRLVFFSSFGYGVSSSRKLVSEVSLKPTLLTVCTVLQKPTLRIVCTVPRSTRADTVHVGKAKLALLGVKRATPARARGLLMPSAGLTSVDCLTGPTATSHLLVE